MTTPRTVNDAVAAAAAAVTAQQAARAATVNAAAIAGLSAGESKPALPPAVTGDPGATDGYGSG